MLNTIINLLVATSLAGLVGLQREIYFQKNNIVGLGGFRTFAMLGAIGFISVYIEKEMKISGFVLMSFLSIVLLIITGYIYSMFRKKNNFGITSELSIISGFVIGIMVMEDKIVLAITTSILFAFLLDFKVLLHDIAKNFNKDEFFAIIKFLIISGVILPILPNYTIDPWNIFNPKLIWLMVVFVAGIRFVGFFLSKIFGQKKGIVLTGILGGLMSSTAVASSLSLQSKKEKNTISPFIAGIFFASSIMFIRVFLEAQAVTQTINKDVFISDLSRTLIIPLSIMTIVSTIIAIFFFYEKNDYIINTKNKFGFFSKKETEINEEKKQPFSLSEAIKFAIFFIFVLAAVKFLPIFLGDKGLYVTAIISGLADTDAITLSVSSLVSKGEIDYRMGASVITTAVIMNTIVKIFIITFFGGKKLRNYSIVLFSIVIICGFLSLFFI